jgi:ribosomal protein S24E
MNIQITVDEKKPLLKRRELQGKLGYEAKTPARLEIRKELAKKLGAKEELIIVKRVKPDYGTQSAHLEFYVYDDEKALKDLEHEYMLVRHGAAKKEEKKEEAAPEEKK